MLRRGLTIVCAAICAACSFDPGSFRSFGGDGAPDVDAAGSIDGAPDAAPMADATRPPDAEPDASPPLGPFSPPGLAPGINTYSNEDDPTLRADLLEIYFNSDRAGGVGSGDIWRATRASTTDGWSGVENVAGLNTAYNETTPEITAGGLTIYFASDRPGTVGGTDIYRATRFSVLDSFGFAERIDELSSGSNDFSAHEQPGGVTLYLGSNRIGGVGGIDIYRTVRLAPGIPWSYPSLLLEVDTASVDSDSWVDATDMVIYFSSDRAGGIGGRDLWTGQRGAFVGMFGSLILINELNSASDDMDPWLSPDQRTVFFSTNRLGDEDIFVSSR